MIQSLFIVATFKMISGVPNSTKWTNSHSHVGWMVLTLERCTRRIGHNLTQKWAKSVRTYLTVCISLHIHPWINPYMHPSIIQPSIHPLSSGPFIHAVNQPSSRPTHTPLIQWLTLHWVNRYSLEWHHCKRLGRMAGRCLCTSCSR